MRFYFTEKRYKTVVKYAEKRDKKLAERVGKRYNNTVKTVEKRDS